MGFIDTNTPDVDEYYYLFNSPMVRTQLQQNFIGKDLDHKKIVKRFTKRTL